MPSFWTFITQVLQQVLRKANTILQSCQLTRFRHVTHGFAMWHTLLHVFTRTHGTHPISHGKFFFDFGPRHVRSFSNSPRVAGAKERICNPIRCIDILFTPRSPEVSDRRRVTKRDKRGRNSGREYIAEENLHLQSEQRLGMLMTCGSIKYSLS